MQTVQGQSVPVRNQERPSSFVGSVLGCARRALGPVAPPAAAVTLVGLANLPGVAATGAGIDYQAICIEARDAGEINSAGTQLDCETPLKDYHKHEDRHVIEATLDVDMGAVCAQCTPPNAAQGRPSNPLGPIGANWATLRGDTAARQASPDDRRLASTDAPVRRLASGYRERSVDEQIFFASELVATCAFLITVGEAGRGAIQRRIAGVESAVEDTPAASVDAAGIDDQELARVAPGFETSPRIYGRDDGSIDVVHPEAASPAGSGDQEPAWVEPDLVSVDIETSSRIDGRDDGSVDVGRQAAASGRGLRWAQGSYLLNAVGPEGLQLLAQIVTWAYLTPPYSENPGFFQRCREFCSENREVVAGQTLSHIFDALVKCINKDKLPFLNAKYGHPREQLRSYKRRAEAVGYFAEFVIGTGASNGTPVAAKLIYRGVKSYNGRDNDNKKGTQQHIDFNSLSPQQKAQLRVDVFDKISYEDKTRIVEEYVNSLEQDRMTELINEMKAVDFERSESSGPPNEKIGRGEDDWNPVIPW